MDPTATPAMDPMDELGGGKTLQGCWSRKIAAGMYEQASDVDDLEHVFNDTSAEPIKISYAVLKSITKNFGQVIGRGGFGVVYLVVQKFRELSTKAEIIPSSLVEIAPILHVANEVEEFNPRVAYRCRIYAFEKAHCLDPTSNGRGVREFKTALLQRLDREIDRIGGRTRPSDSREMQSFYHQYYKRYIQALENAADKVDRAKLAEAYQTAVVLFEVLEAANLFEPLQVDQEILEINKQIQENKKLYFP
ncbi:hypothetical protein PR202_ga17131 [Eleusine coracana subsp. coracana]|uniref:1,3-beta-glucan synthase n=1 Tax=Eleusine coracana subsp. coracana TaxID=191504 RepID=A0AAV5CN69_ELECO|nr:hypothetical protein PR202_ga17131 [Eleusine coracana subsp. coracana]